MPGFEFFGEEERKEVMDVLDSGILMRYGFDGARKGHWKAKELESAICTTFQVKHAQLVSSGTAALTTALTALGVGYGDEVIIPTFTFVASFEAILSVGAIPVFVDIDDTLTLNPQAVENAITLRTKAIMPVHMCGSMADLDPLQALCKQYNLLLIEDACQAIGGTYKGKALGTIGDAGTFSFDFVKIITCGEGGTVITNKEEVWKNCDHYTDHGHDHLGVDRGADLHPFVGYNFRISELQAAVGLAQIRKLAQFIAIQKSHKQVLKSAIGGIPGITFRRVPDLEGDSASFLSFFCETAEDTALVSQEMKKAGLATFYWYDNNWHYLRKWAHLKNATTLSRLNPLQVEYLQTLNDTDFSVSDAYMSRCISTPIQLSWSEADVQAKAEALKQSIISVLANRAKV